MNAQGRRAVLQKYNNTGQTPGKDLVKTATQQYKSGKPTASPVIFQTEPQQTMGCREPTRHCAWSGTEIASFPYTRKCIRNSSHDGCAEIITHNNGNKQDKCTSPNIQSTSAPVLVPHQTCDREQCCLDFGGSLLPP